MRYACQKIIVATLLFIMFGSGCATSWQNQGSFERSMQTRLLVESEPSGKVFVNNRYVGLAPVEAPLDYGQEVEKRTRKVSYWKTQPGWSVLLSVASLGIYIPFSLIPVDIETSLVPQKVFMNNVFAVGIEAEGYKECNKQIQCSGEKRIVLHQILKEEEGKTGQ